MMRRMLTKELREKRWPALAFMVILLAGTHLGVYSSLFAGSVGYLNPLALQLAMLMTLIMGLVGYAGETSAGRADFLMSRPVQWKSLMAAKLIVGLGSILLIVAVAGLSYWLLLPSEYHQFAPLSRAALGMGLLLALAWISYLAGFVCSMVLPGVFGSGLTLALVWITGIITLWAFDYYHIKSLAWPLFAAIASAPVAAIVIARFGLTLTAGERARRYALAVIAVVAMVSPIGYLTGRPVFIALMRENSGSLLQEAIWDFDHLVSPEKGVFRHPQLVYETSLVSPDGSTLLLRKHRDQWAALMDLETGKVGRFDLGSDPEKSVGPSCSGWLSGSSYLFYTGNELRIANINQAGNVSESAIRLNLASRTVIRRLFISPDKRLALAIVAHDGPPFTDLTRCQYYLVDPTTGRSALFRTDTFDVRERKSKLVASVEAPRATWITGKYAAWANWLISGRAFTIRSWSEEVFVNPGK